MFILQVTLLFLTTCVFIFDLIITHLDYKEYQKDKKGNDKNEYRNIKK